MTNSNKGNEEMVMEINDDILTMLRQIIENQQPEDLTSIKVEKDSITVGISRDPNDLMVLEQINFEGQAYYVGLLK